MNIRSILRPALLTALLVGLLSLMQPAVAEQRLIAGDESGDQLVATGVVDTVTSPGQLVNEIGKDASNFGPGALITGTYRGAVKGGLQALQGGGRILIGIMDVLTAPLKDDVPSTY